MDLRHATAETQFCTMSYSLVEHLKAGIISRDSVGAVFECSFHVRRNLESEELNRDLLRSQFRCGIPPACAVSILFDTTFELIGPINNPRYGLSVAGRKSLEASASLDLLELITADNPLPPCLMKYRSDRGDWLILAERLRRFEVAFGPECVKMPNRTLAMISEDFIVKGRP